MPTYILKIDASHIGSDDTTFSKEISTGTQSANSITPEVAANSSEDNHVFTVAGVPLNDDWEDGDVTVEVNVTTADMDMHLNLWVARCNSAGSEQEASAFSGEQTLDSTGVKTFTWSGLTWTSGTDTDILKVNYRFRNSHTHSAKSVVIETGTTDTEHTTAITDNSAPAVTRRIFVMTRRKA